MTVASHTDNLEVGRVFRFGRERTQHDWRVTVVGDDATGYCVQVQTRCLRVISGDETAVNIEGSVTCAACVDVMPPPTPAA